MANYVGYLGKDLENAIISAMLPYAARGDSFRLFADEYGWQDWMNDYTEAEDGEPIREGESAAIDDCLRQIWDRIEENPVRCVRAQTGLTQAAFAARYEIPRRTIENWESGVSTPPPYVINLLAQVVATGKKEQL